MTRYNDPDYREPATFLLLSVFIYFAGYLGGVTFARSGSRLEKLAAFSGVVPALLETFVIGARTGFISFVICWIASYLCNARVYGRAAAVAQLAPRVGHIGFGSNSADDFVCDGASDAYERHLYDPGPDSIATTEGQEILLKFSVGSARIQFVGYRQRFVQVVHRELGRVASAGSGAE